MSGMAIGDGPVKRYRCTECNRICEQQEVLVAHSPFEPCTDVWGCPTCKSIDQFVNVCDEPGCDAQASCGWPTPHKEGEDTEQPTLYRMTCYDHSIFKFGKDK